MSGTSGDGIDCVLWDCQKSTIAASLYQPFPNLLKDEVLTVAKGKALQPNALYLLEKALTEAYAMVVLSLLKQQKIAASQVNVIGCHGQTIYHCAKSGLSIQLCDGASLAYLTGIAVVCDFRRADLARGGQGAPFAPIFHQQLFLNDKPNCAIVNIGGIANVSLFNERGTLIGFDVGPGNVILDAFVKDYWQKSYDENGKIAKQGRQIPALLEKLIDEPWFKLKGPKSLDREDFSLLWLKKKVAVDEYVKEDILKTLVDFTAFLIQQAIYRVNPNINHLVVCGGGAKNLTMMEALKAYFNQVSLTTDEGIDADFVEAALFAWLANKRVNNEVLSWQSVTGSKKEGVYGAHYLP